MADLGSLGDGNVEGTKLGIVSVKGSLWMQVGNARGPVTAMDVLGPPGSVDVNWGSARS